MEWSSEKPESLKEDQIEMSTLKLQNAMYGGGYDGYEKGSSMMLF